MIFQSDDKRLNSIRIVLIGSKESSIITKIEKADDAENGENGNDDNIKVTVNT